MGYHHGLSQDPHIERLTESFAFLSSKIHQRLDEDLPEVMEALLQNLAPQFLYKYPSSCIISIEPSHNSSGMTDICNVPSGTPVFSRNKFGTVCNFKTVYPLTIIPATINEARLYYDKQSSLWKIEVKLQFLDGVQFSTDFIRFYLHGHANLTGTIYTLMCSESDFTVLKKNDCILNNIKPDISFVGFEEHEISLPRINNISYIHHLVLDYYSFSDKFSFLI